MVGLSLKRFGANESISGKQLHCEEVNGNRAESVAKPDIGVWMLQHAQRILIINPKKTRFLSSKLKSNPASQSCLGIDPFRANYVDPHFRPESPCSVMFNNVDLPPAKQSRQDCKRCDIECCFICRWAYTICLRISSTKGPTSSAGKTHSILNGLLPITDVCQHYWLRRL